MLCDTGPLITLIDPSQQEYVRCAALYKQTPLPLITTWACFVEAMYFAGRDGGFPREQSLWRMQRKGVIHLHEHSDAAVGRMAELMFRYRNVPMDLADASLIAAAEVLREDTIFTLDSDFRIYRLRDGSALKLLPE